MGSLRAPCICCIAVRPLGVCVPFGFRHCVLSSVTVARLSLWRVGCGVGVRVRLLKMRERCNPCSDAARVLVWVSLLSSNRIPRPELA